ncbi:GNAT family N-acetyltransferase [Helcobacillus massiliensis]|uniref:GNAT family N-acetyltransferase n=1 Tax=Helcobacillus massiliensis TaxID=521392 RepID=UPI002552D3E0|nr:GNAT family N-acetyltransferase [Helcobacillus massiliensis]MDK7742928.1 GNAT family N-acetyltransferase [Helcobacillus massiliensis]WOO92079.1 GNAT family N-acetyltransferase [Helcobacillus massiliensis]
MSTLITLDADLPEGITMHAAHIRDIDPVMLYRLAKLRQDVFTMEQGATDADLDGRETEDGTRLVWCERDGIPLAHLRVLDDGANLRVGRLAVSKDARRLGLGGRVMRAGLDLTEQIDADRVVKIDAQSYLEQWYLGMGYVTTGDHFMEAGIDHVPMEFRHR